MGRLGGPGDLQGVRGSCRGPQGLAYFVPLILQIHPISSRTPDGPGTLAVGTCAALLMLEAQHGAPVSLRGQPLPLPSHPLPHDCGFASFAVTFENSQKLSRLQGTCNVRPRPALESLKNGDSHRAGLGSKTPKLLAGPKKRIAVAQLNLRWDHFSESL